MLDLTLTFSGNRAIAWRNALDQIPQAKLYDFVERELVAPSFDGGHVRELKVDGADALDQPLVMHVQHRGSGAREAGARRAGAAPALRAEPDAARGAARAPHPAPSPRLVARRGAPARRPARLDEDAAGDGARRRRETATRRSW